MQTEVLKINNLEKSFNQGEQATRVLKGVNFSVFDGEYVAISGPSGCGKSTLLNLMGLLDTPDSGEYYIDGLLVSELDANQRAAIRSRRIGFVFQSFNLIDEFSVVDNVALPLKYRGDSKLQRRTRALECLERVGLADKAGLFPNQLSGGQQQRVSIARALAADSGIMLVDEPTGNLDTNNANSVMQLLQKLHQNGATICMVTHDPRSADQAQRNIEILDGVIISDKRRKSDDNGEEQVA